MKGLVAQRFLIVLAVAFALSGLRVAAALPAANEDFSAVGKAIVELLQGRDAAGFATAVTPSVADWKSALDAHAPNLGQDPTERFRLIATDQQKTVTESAKQLLAKADSLHVDFSKGLQAKVSVAGYLGSIHYPSVVELPYAPTADVVLTSPASKGEFRIRLNGLIKFSGGWRCSDGLQWISFPTGVADAKTISELALEAKIAIGEGLNGADDPALFKLGDTLVRFIREQDVAVYERDAFITSDLIWDAFKNSGQKGPSRNEIDEHIKEESRKESAVAYALVQQMQDQGINLKNAEIKIEDALVEHARAEGPEKSAMFLMGQRFKVKFAVKSPDKSKTGVPLTGEYVLAANQAMRFSNEWRVANNIHWAELPPGVLDEKANAQFVFDSYVAQFGTLPPRTTVPEIEFTTLAGEKKMKLSDLRGKVVVLDFWATWCGPCQEPMANLQQLRDFHPGWGDKVAIVPLSIDDTLAIVRNHVNKRRWTQTLNVWAGEGGWNSAPALRFRVTGVPTTYIIDPQGKIVKAGHPASMDIGEEVDKLLAQASHAQ